MTKCCREDTVIEKEKVMKDFERYRKELDALEQGKSQYVWDELEELITQDFEEEKISSEEFDSLMQRLMGIDCE